MYIIHMCYIQIMHNVTNQPLPPSPPHQSIQLIQLLLFFGSKIVHMRRARQVVNNVSARDHIENMHYSYQKS